MNIRDRLLVMVFAVWLVAAASFALLAKAIYDRETGQAEAAIREYAQTLNLIVERELDQRAALARGLGSSASLQQNDLRRFHDEASTATRGTDSWVILVTPEFQVLNSRLPWQEGLRIRRPPDSPMVTSDTTDLFFATEGPVTKGPVIALFAPELGVTPPRYDVGIAFEPEAIQAIIRRQPAPDGVLVSVMDDDQLVMARSRDPQLWVGRSAGPEIRRRARNGIEGFLRSRTLDGVESVTYVTRPNRYHWAVVVARPVDALALTAKRLTLQAVGAAAVLLLVALGLALWVSRRLSVPVQALQEAAKALREDRVPDTLRTGIRELDEISEAINRAGVRTAEATRALERRVADAVREARDAQAKLLEGQKHEAIGRLTGGIAHDFNNLLQTIRTALEVFGKSPAAPPAPRVLDSAMRASNRAAELVRQMLAFGRSKPQRLDAINFANFLLDARELVQKAIGKSIELVADIDPDLPNLHVDGSQLELALLNLVFNARDAMPQGGRVVISASKAGHDRLLVAVSDNGPGMDETTLSRAMEPYFTTKPVGAGSGLGLAQVRAFATQSGGEARIHSVIGQGTRVELLLPTTNAAPADSIGSPTPAQGGTLRILMVEDNVLVQSVVVPALEAVGHAVTLAQTADAALGLLQEGALADVLFTDVVMPGKLSGMDLAVWCRTHRPDLPVVVATGYSSQMAKEVTVLNKPYELETLLGVLSRAVASAAAVAPRTDVDVPSAGT